MSTWWPQARGCGGSGTPLLGRTLAWLTRAAPGDDEGHVRLWDSRSREQAGGWRVHEDFVADLCHVPARGTLLSASGDGTLAILDLRAGCVSGRSDNQEDELLSGTS